MLEFDRAGGAALPFVPAYSPTGVRAPMRLPGRFPEKLADPDTRLCRLLGRLVAAADGGRSNAEVGRSAATDGGLATPPIDIRSDAIDGGRGIPVDSRLLSRLLGVSTARSEASPICDPIVLGGLLTLRRIVTEDGRVSATAGPTAALGEPLGVVLPRGAGSFDLAECTRSSIFCIRPLRLLI